MSEWLYVLMYCVSTHGNASMLGVKGPECQPLGLYKKAIDAYRAVDEACAKKPMGRQMTAEECDCRRHHWAMKFPVE